MAEFHLPDLDDDISGGNPDVEVSYHATLSDAENGLSSLPEDYTNTEAFSQTIYARATDDSTGCYAITEVQLLVSPTPEIGELEDLSGCDEGNGESTFDLTQNHDNILGTQNPQHLKTTYHESQPDAESGDNAIAGPKKYTSSGKSIFVRLENGQTGCFDTGDFELRVIPGPAIADISIQEEFCSDHQGGDSATIGLTAYDEQINPGSPANTKVVYYKNLSAYSDNEPIENPESYTTTANPQTIIAEVVDTDTGCPSAGFVEITISINDRPEVDLSQYDGRAICWDSDLFTPVEGGNYGPIILEIGLDGSQYGFSWTRDGTALSETGPSLEATEPGVYEVTVTDTDGISTSCTSTSKATIIEANPPEFILSRLSGTVANPHSILVSEVAGIGNFEFRLDREASGGGWVPLREDGTVLFEEVAPGTHIVYGRSLEGCGTTIQTITLIGYPKFFTPNNDGHNDRWNIIGLEEGELYIFDRYGKLLASPDPAGRGWDGIYNGHPMPSDDYWFRVKFTETLPDGSERQGEFKSNFSLVR